jgi:hypothetical protein
MGRFLPLFATFCHLTEGGIAGQAGFSWFYKDLAVVLKVFFESYKYISIKALRNNSKVLGEEMRRRGAVT